MKCYNYQIGYWSHEDSINKTLTHEKFFTKEQFNDLVSDCFVKAFNMRYKMDSELDDDDFTTEKNYSISDLIGQVIDDLINHFGFQEITHQSSFFSFGWSNLNDTSGWNSETKNDEGIVLINKKLNKQK